MAIAAKNKFTAPPAALGYLYQCRYALYLLLERSRADAAAGLSIEKFDDIAFEKAGTPEELIQTKHHLDRISDLTDSSANLWTTLRAWAEAITNATVSPPTVIFTIITTAKAAAGSAASYLKDGLNRNPAKAHELLVKAAARMAGKTLKPAREAFAKLGLRRQQEMLHAIHVVDGSPDITDTSTLIRKSLGFPVPSGLIPAFYERLEGWWLGQLIERLTGRNKTPVSAVALGRAMDDLRDSFRADSLPIDFRSARPPEGAMTTDRAFVKQLRLIQAANTRINWARVDFFRAYAQRSRWLRDNLLALPQLDEYDRVLAEEWERERDRLEERAKEGEPDIEAVKRGFELYEYLQKNCLPIRTNCTEPYVGRGSYHLLADRLLVGWHRAFRELLDSGANVSAGGTK
jgi:ABC-3C protein